MSVPDYRHVPKQLHDTGLYDLKSHDGQGAFVDACVSTLHGIDKNFGHLKKKPGQTQVHGHGEDATLYKFSDGTAQAVDFIGGAGGPNPQPGWGVDSSGPIYKHSDWHNPTEHAAAAQAPPPAAKIKPREQFYFENLQLNAFYASQAGLQRPGGMVKHDQEGRAVADVEAMGAWAYDLMLGATVQDCIKAIRQIPGGEWQQKHPNETP
jgi:hypothetical protein